MSDQRDAALSAIASKSRLLMRSGGGWRDDPERKPLSQMTTDELREVFEWFYNTAIVALKATE